MLLINQLKLPIHHSEQELEEKLRKLLKMNTTQRLEYHIHKRSIDARKKPDLYLVYSILATTPNEKKVLARCKSAQVQLYVPKVYTIPVPGKEALKNRPVVIGAGPAGLFAALLLTEAGFCPLILEQGKAVEERSRDVSCFWETGRLDPTSNVQFGEGGAGTFSDGKLNTAVKDPSGRNTFVLETFVRFGADPQILSDGKPHIGTDVLSSVIRNMRTYLQEKGCIYRFGCKVTDFVFEKGRLSGLVCGSEIIPAQAAILAIGHSSRDTFLRLHELQIPMESKNFAVGFRVEHPQRMIDQAMYGRTDSGLPASPYKVTANFPGGRGVYSFCMCPGGYVVNSSSFDGGTVVNGMSYSGRKGENANSAIIVSVGPSDFGSTDPLAGMRYQQRLEAEVYARGRGKIPQQLFGDYKNDCCSCGYGDFASAAKGAVCFASLRGLLSGALEESFCAGMEHFGHIIPGFDRGDAILSGMESRTSSPIHILRDDTFQSSFRGLYPCGEGAGYAGGITSAAMDGMKVAEALINYWAPAK